MILCHLFYLTETFCTFKDFQCLEDTKIASVTLKKKVENNSKSQT